MAFQTLMSSGVTAVSGSFFALARYRSPPAGEVRSLRGRHGGPVHGAAWSSSGPLSHKRAQSSGADKFPLNWHRIAEEVKDRAVGVDSSSELLVPRIGFRST